MKRRIDLFIKRFFDISCSFLGLILISWLLILLAIIIKCSSKGPIFFKQERLGKNGKVFKIIKFRTMVINAEKTGDGIYINSENDNRITKVGKFLRKTSLDELPQLFNVFAGSMSLIGPRPPVVYHPYDGYEKYPDWAKKRFEMKPGMTGLVQCTIRNSASWDERIVIDNEYIDNFTIWLDVKILFKTFFKVLKGSDTY